MIGCGGIGLSAINAAAIAGAGRIVAVDRTPAKTEMALAFGATDFVDASAGDAAKQVRELTGGGVHHAIEAVGLAATAEQAFAMLRRGGVATIVGMIPVDQKVSVPGWQFLAEKTLRGSLMGSNQFRTDMPWFVDLYLHGRLKLDEMVSAHRPLSEINEAYDDMRRGTMTRTVIDFPH